MSKRNAKIVHLFALIALVANLFAPVFTQPVLAEDLVPSEPVVTSSTESDEAEAQRQAEEEEAERKRIEEETRQKAEADAAATRAAEEEAARQQAEADAAATKAAEEDAAATKAAEDAAATKAAEDAAATKSAEEDAAATKAAEDAAATKAAEEDAAATKAAEDAAATKAAEGKSSDVVAPNNGNSEKPQQKVNAPAISLVPQDPQIQGCGDDLSVTAAKGPAGITYSVHANGDGSHTATAAIDPSMHGSHTLNVEGTQWKIDGEVAHYHVDPVPCPEMKTLGEGQGHNPVTICHRNGQSGNWKELTLDAEGVVKNGHMDHQDGQDIIPEFVYNGKTYGPRPENAQEIIDNGCKVPKDTGAPVVDTVDATCGPDGYMPSTLTISAEGFKVLSTEPTAASTNVNADGMGTYTFENENDISVKVRIEVKEGYTYANNSGWSYEQGSSPYIKYKTFSLKGTECEPELTIEKTADNPPAYANGVSWTITVKNHGDAKQRVKVIETSPDGEWTWELLGGYCDPDGVKVGGQWQWTCEFDVPAQKHGSPGVKTLTFSSEMAKECGTYSNTVTLKAGEKKGYGYIWTTVGTASSTVDKQCAEPELSIEKELIKPHKDTAKPGDTIAFKVTVKNHGKADANGVTFTDTLPADFVGQGWNWDLDGCSLNGNVITCGPFDLGKNKSKSFTFTATVPNDGSVCGEFTNTATLDGENGGVSTLGYNPQPKTTDSASVTIECEPELSIEKKLTSSEIAKPGEPISFKVKVKNTGTGSATDVSFTDSMDTELASLDWTVDEACKEQGDGSWSCGPFDLSAGAEWDFEFSATVPVDGSVCGEFTNTATLDGENGGVSTLGYNPQPNTTDSASVTIECEPEIKIEKSANKESVERGDSFTYTIDVKNIGDTTLSGYVVTDELDTDYLSFESSVDGLCSESTPGSGLVTCDVAELTPDGQDGQTSQTFTITVKVPDNLDQAMCGTWIKNSAHVGLPDLQISGAGGDNSGPVEATSKTVKTWLKNCDPDLSIEKKRTSSWTAEPGDTIEFKVTVKNTGSGNAPDVYFTDIMDATLAELDWTVDDACDRQDDGSYLCGPFVLDAETGKQEFTFSAEVPRDGSVCSDKWLTNTATIVDGNDNDQPEISTSGYKGGETSSSARVKIDCDPGIKIEKSDQLGSYGRVSPGQEFTYKITVKNTGNTELSGYVMTDTLPLDYLDFVGFGEGTTCDGPTESGAVTCAVETLSPSSGSGDNSQTFYITVKVKTALDPWMCDDEIKNVANVASVVVSESGDVQSSSHSNDDVSDSTKEVTKFKEGACTPNIDITKTDNVGKGEAVEPGGSYTYTITVTNNGDIDASNYSMADTLRDYLTFNFANGGPDGCSVNGQDIECDLPILAPGASWSIDVPVTLTDSPSSYVCKYGAFNKAEVAQVVISQSISTSGHGGGKSGTYDKAVELTPVNCDPRIEVEKTDDLNGEKAEPGESFSYTITVTNAGNVELTNVEVQDLLPAGLQALAWTETDGMDCDLSDLKCTISTLGVEQSQTLELEVEFLTSLTAEMCDGVTNVVNASGNSSVKPGTSDDDAPRSQSGSQKTFTVRNSAEWLTTPDCVPDYEFEKTSGSDTVTPGEEISFTITLTNIGNIDFKSIEITDAVPRLPTGTWAISESTSYLDCGDIGAGGDMTCTFPYEIVPGGDVSVTLTAEVPNKITLPDTEWCKTWANNASAEIEFSNGVSVSPSSSADVQVNCTGVSIEKNGSDEVVPGDNLTYTILVTNMGNTPAHGILVEDSLDPRLSIISASFNGTDCDVDVNDIDCFIGTLPVEGSAEITITADVIAEPTTEQCDEVIENIAELTLLTPRSLQSIIIPQTFPIESDLVQTGIDCTPDLELEKDGSVSDEGTIAFIITATNSGTGSATELSIVDTLPDGLVGLDWDISVEPADTDAACGIDEGVITCEPVFLDQYDGMFEITLTAETGAQTPVCGEYMNNATMGDIEASAMVVIDCAPNYEVEKTSSMTVDADDNDALSVGDTITYTISVTNTGNQHLSGITLDDQFSGAGEGGLTWIEPEGFDGENVPTVNVDSSIDLVATYVITQADVDTGEIENCALMTYQVDDESSLDRDDCIDDEIEQTPDYAVEKTSANTDDADENDALSVGDTITYTITVTNTGNLTLNDIMLDDQFSGAGEGGLTWIAPEGFDGENVPTVNVDSSIDLVATYVITQADVDAGEIENCAFMTYQVDEETVIDRDDCVDNPLEQEPVFTVEKTSANTDDADDNGAMSEGDTITYTITVTNTGNQTLNGITLDDQFSGAGEDGLTWIAPEGFDGVNVPTVNVDSSIDLVATYVITQADVDAGEIENCALMTYQVDEETVIERDDCEEDEIPQNPSISMEKVGTATDNPDVLALGNIVTYTFTITNTGDVTLTDLEIEDPMVGVRFEDGNVIESLAPGESVQKRARYAVAQLDMDNGLIVNCADIIAMAPDGSGVTDDSCDTRLIDQDLSLAVGHECPGFDDGVLLAAGDAVEFEITISNPGNVSVHNVTVVATREGSFNEPFSSTFEPGQEETRTYTVIATEEEAETLEVHVGFTVTGDMQAGVNQLMASMAMMQSTGDRTTSSTDFDCGLGERPVPVVPDTPSKPATDSAVKAVSQLPSTGSGSVASAASVLWAAAMLSVFALGATAVGIRVKHRR